MRHVLVRLRAGRLPLRRRAARRRLRRVRWARRCCGAVSVARRRRAAGAAGEGAARAARGCFNSSFYGHEAIARLLLQVHTIPISLEEVQTGLERFAAKKASLLKDTLELKRDAIDALKGLAEGCNDASELAAS